MEIGQRFSIGNDSVTVIAQDVQGSGLGWVFAMVICPRSEFYQYFFEHEAVRYYSLNGALLFEMDGEARRLERDEFIDIPANTPYRMRGLERQPVKLYITSPSGAALQSFREIGQAVQAHAKTNYIGEVRYV